MNPVYFDHNATTRVDDAVMAAMLPYFQQEFGNPSSRHAYGTVARRAINKAREQVAAAVGVQPVQVIFTSGGSEANNLFIRGAADSQKPGNIAISAIEHPCILQPTLELARRTSETWTMQRLAVDGQGRVDIKAAENTMAKQSPNLVSVMLANNETGVIQDVAYIAEIARSHDAWMHTDAVQGLGKIPVNFSSLKVHAMTLSGHKIYGPKGAAALIVDKRLLLKPLIFGGGHENGMRSGTENVPAIVGFGVACELAKLREAETAKHVQRLREHLQQRRGLRFGAGRAGHSVRPDQDRRPGADARRPDLLRAVCRGDPAAVRAAGRGRRARRDARGERPGDRGLPQPAPERERPADRGHRRRAGLQRGARRRRRRGPALAAQVPR